MAPSEQEQLIAGFFHAMRAQRKKRDVGAEVIVAAFDARYRAQLLARHLDDLADRHDWDRRWD